MRSLWLLPDTLQTGSVNVLENGVIKPLHEAISLATLPLALILGVPEELLEKYRDDAFIYSQICAGKSGERYFACSMRAGKDIGGRSVFITNLQILGAREFPMVPPPTPAMLPESMTSVVSGLIDGLSQRTNFSAAATFKMLEAERTRGAGTYSSEILKRSANRHEWMPKKKVFTSAKFKVIAVGCLVLTLLFIVREWLVGS